MDCVVNLCAVHIGISLAKPRPGHVTRTTQAVESEESQRDHSEFSGSAHSKLFYTRACSVDSHRNTGGHAHVTGSRFAFKHVGAVLLRLDDHGARRR